MTKKKHRPLFLVCVNDKEHSRTALKFAIARAIATEGGVAMLSVVDRQDYHTIFSVGDVIKQERLAESRKLLEELAQEVQSETGIVPKLWVREGLIADEICATIGENPAVSFLVLGVAADGSSNKGGLLTSLTEKIGKDYHIPLLIVPGNLTDAEIGALS
jgi:nucleotide-binding universal stress UspA family protein